MIRLRRISGLAPVLFAAAIGCGGNAPASSTPSGSADTAEAHPGDVAQVGAGENDDQSTADLAEHHRHHHHGGFAMFIAMSLEGLNTTPDQQGAITKIRADLHAKMQPAHDAEKTLLSVIADGIAAGNIDQARVDAAMNELASTSGAIHDAVGDSLNALHATLTPPQRQALVDKMEAHFEVWHNANAPDEGVDRDTKGGHLGQLAKDIGLAPDQVEKVRANFASMIGSAPKYDRAEADAHIKAFGAAFASDTFDSKSLGTTGAVNAHIATWGATRMVTFYKALAPVLTPEQRTKVADMLRKHANYKRTETGT